MNSNQFSPACLDCKFFPCSARNECEFRHQVSDTKPVEPYSPFEAICFDHNFDYLGLCRCGAEDPEWEPWIQEHF